MLFKMLLLYEKVHSLASCVTSCVLYVKGSENKHMLSKLKLQLEEIRSKVVFLDCVKKYLEVLILSTTAPSTAVSHVFPDNLSLLPVDRI